MMSLTQPQAHADELADTFDLLGDWEDRYRFIIDLGKQLPPLADYEKTEATRVHGCQATVHLVWKITPNEQGDGDVLTFRAQSDAAIVNGLIAILEKLFDAQPPRDILAFDIEGFLNRVGLDEHLSPTRRNGLHEMVKRLRTAAAAHAA